MFRYRRRATGLCSSEKSVVEVSSVVQDLELVTDRVKERKALIVLYSEDPICQDFLKSQLAMANTWPRHGLNSRSFPWGRAEV